jgi:hypothetical protein
VVAGKYLIPYNLKTLFNANKRITFMVSRCFGRFSAGSGFLFLVIFFAFTSAGAASMKLHMADGTSIEVPYYWISGEEIKFDIAGGVAGIPRSQVVSVEEILEAREFDPTVILESAQATPGDQKQLIEKLVSEKVKSPVRGVTETGEALEKYRSAAETGTTAGQGGKPVSLFSVKFGVQKALPVMCDEPSGPVLYFQDIVGGRDEAKLPDFNLVLYDGEGKVLQKKQCEVYPLSLDNDLAKKLQLKGKLFLVRAGVKPDSKIKRYEIAAGR